MYVYQKIAINDSFLLILSKKLALQYKIWLSHNPSEFKHEYYRVHISSKKKLNCAQ